jgi:hypothetical protein
VRRLRVLQTLDAVGGVWRYALDLARGLAPLGVETAFLGFGPPPSPAARAEALALGALDWSDQPLDWLAREPSALAGVPGAVAAAALGAARGSRPPQRPLAGRGASARAARPGLLPFLRDDLVPRGAWD